MNEQIELLLKRKVFVSTVGWLGAIFSGLLIYFSVFAIINMTVLFQDGLFDDFTSDLSEIGGFFVEGLGFMIVIYGLIIVFGVAYLVSSIGPLKYKYWGRDIFVVISWLLIVFALVIAIFYIIFSSTIISKVVRDVFPLGNVAGMSSVTKTMLGLQIVSYGILLIVFIRALFRVVIRLNKIEYKRLFN